MVRHDYQLSPLEMAISLMAMIIGVGVLTVPRSLAVELNTPDGWISLVLAGLFVMGIVTLYVLLQKQFPSKTILEFLAEGTVGRYASYVLGFMFILYFISLSGYEARILAFVVKMYLLDQTPSEVLVLLILICTMYAVSKGFQAIVHLNFLFLPIIVLVLVSLISFNITEIEIDNLRPVTPEGAFVPIMGLKETVFTFIGIEIILFFMSRMKKEDLKAKRLNIGIGITTLLYITITILAYSLFTVDAVKLITFPTVELAKVIEIPGAFFERLESVMITVWIMGIFNTLSITHYLSVEITKKHFLRRMPLSTLAILTSVIIFLVTFIPPNIVKAFKFGDWIGYTGLTLYLLCLLFGFLTILMRAKQKKKKDDQRPIQGGV
ncbi:GerAB/ArcD/ProY family transporter [Caldalkalibacillus salinus]|uniref:GerAB/ArcD/ProY family transporter n=1 Tax=Caldalkalibacillus salinus TaxID=2803787 RepID=UPI0019245EF8|nr:GerAB/ArcD/ProY family transporter [Caldalkalibacillus salinus]